MYVTLITKVLYKVLQLYVESFVFITQSVSDANSLKISSVACHVQDVIAELPEKPVQYRLVQTDKEDLTYKQHLRWSHWSLSVQVLIDQRTA